MEILAQKQYREEEVCLPANSDWQTCQELAAKAKLAEHTHPTAIYTGIESFL